MTSLEVAAILLAGVGAGIINSIVGSGTLLTFPTLLALGVPPVTANMSNALGLVPGSVAGAIGYRRELAGQRSRVLRLAGATVLGSVAGAVLLLVLAPGAFRAIVPVLILLGVGLVVAQPWLARRVRERAAAQGRDDRPDAGWVWPAMLTTGVYGGYFGAAFGVISMGVLGSGVHDSLQRLNALKNVLAACTNATASVVFIAAAQLGLAGSAEIDWAATGLIALGATRRRVPRDPDRLPAAAARPAQRDRRRRAGGRRRDRLLTTTGERPLPAVLDRHRRGVVEAQEARGA